jgi:hypothetical protein
MIDDLDEVLRHLLVREIPIKNGEVDVKFDQPRREWSARLNRPTLNIFLYDIRENAKLRQARAAWQIERQPDGTALQRRKAVRVDLHYLITAWANEPEDEHRMLTGILLALFRNPELPEDLLPESLHDQPAPISITVAQENELQNPTDIWNVLDNEMRPVVNCVLTMAIDPYQPVVSPLVRTRELRFGQAAMPAQRQLDQPAAPDIFWTIGGTLHSQHPLEQVRLTLVERGLDVPVLPEGRFNIGRLEAGNYTLEAVVDGGRPRRYPITVPSPDYDIEV